MKSIRKQLTLGLVLGLAVLLGAGGAGIYFMARSALGREFDSGLKARVLTMAALPKAEHGRVEFEFRETQPPRGMTNAAEFFQFFATNGASVRRSRSLDKADLPPQFGTLAQPRFWGLTLPNGTPGRAVGVRFVVHGEHEDFKPDAKPSPGAIELGLVLAAGCGHLNETFRTLEVIVIGAGLLTLAATAILVPLVLRRGLAPVERLAAQAERINAASLQTRFPTDHLPAELGPIAHRLNDLLSRLDESFQRERRFSADLAHELRTPIAALRTISEVSVKWSEGGDIESFQAVQEIAQQMQSMITRLLALARSEQKTIPLDPQPVFVASVVESLWQPNQEKAARKKLAVQLTVPVEARVHTDPTLWRGILLNLLNNAVDYTPPRGAIRVAFQEEAEQFTLAVTNTVNNLQPADLPHLFQRFWRKDKVRSDGDHTGLGLSLVKSFAELLGLELTASLNETASELTLTLRGRVIFGAEPSLVPGPGQLQALPAGLASEAFGTT